MKNNIQWYNWSTVDSDFAGFTVGRYKAIVQDCDGDGSVWTIYGINKSGLTEELCGSDGYVYSEYKQYHFDIAKEECIDYLIALCKPEGLYK